MLSLQKRQSTSTKQLDSVAETVRGGWTGEYLVLAERLGGATDTLLAEIASAGGTTIGVIAANPDPGAAETRVPTIVLAERTPMSRAGFAAALREPPGRLRGWIDGIDPSAEAPVVATNFVELDSVCGRRVLGRRPVRWSAYEDKTVIDELFARADVPTPAYEVVDVAPQPIADAYRRVCGRDGAVLALDSSTDFRGDANGLRWLGRDLGADGLIGASAWAEGLAARVRVSEFVEGVPCSVLAVVGPDGVSAFDPIEIVTLRDSVSRELVFIGSSTFWRPAGPLNAEIRDAALRVGALLQTDAGYRGFFSIDGVVTAAGFVATELNPRLASGLGLREARPDFPIYLLSRSLGDGTMPFGMLDIERFASEARSAIRASPSASLTIPADKLRGRSSPDALRGADRFVSSIHGVHPSGEALRGVDGLVGRRVAALAVELGWPTAQSFRTPE
ncbi:hypothetical protein [Curtobacterium sp. VKM Ac-1376]|uniref:hypothetical protein n=1 Tax=Curtobacterium sp. VKM Ac-1376 TaxID=123312 RepID=UPI00188A5CC6|nr:hypothetical protein [Curtobacterium sp. VKM Ac-1376]MBF4615479.1 hypothetical protein [Curtobacterium sp. VKM Ac-1376]